MHIISKKRLLDFGQIHADVLSTLLVWHRVTSKSQWSDINDVRRTFPTADAVKVKSGTVITVFNLKGNHYRLITSIYYPARQVYIKMVLTHAQYSQNQWKDQL